MQINWCQWVGYARSATYFNYIDSIDTVLQGTFTLVVEAWHDATDDGPQPGTHLVYLYGIFNYGEWRSVKTWAGSEGTWTGRVGLGRAGLVVPQKNYGTLELINISFKLKFNSNTTKMPQVYNL